jgi:hypothetical protein
MEMLERQKMVVAGNDVIGLDLQPAGQKLVVRGEKGTGEKGTFFRL